MSSQVTHPDPVQSARLSQQTWALQELLAARQPLALCFGLSPLIETIPEQKALVGLFEECLILSLSPRPRFLPR